MSNFVHIEKQPTERRRSAAATLYGGCRCSCCLHTLGSVLGATIAPTYGAKPEGEPPDDCRPFGASSVAVHWWLAFLLVFACFASAVLSQEDAKSLPEALGVTSFAVLMTFPGIQLASAFLTLIVFSLWPRPDRVFQLKRAAAIIVGITIGAVAGLLVMVPFFFASLR